MRSLEGAAYAEAELMGNGEYMSARDGLISKFIMNSNPTLIFKRMASRKKPLDISLPRHLSSSVREGFNTVNIDQDGDIDSEGGENTESEEDMNAIFNELSRVRREKVLKGSYPLIKYLALNY